MVFEEIMINQFLQSFTNPLLDIFFQLITYFGHPLIWFVLAAWLFWLGKEKKSFMLMTVLLFSSFISGALKQIFARPRPTGLIALDDLNGYSFPSGHSTLAGTIAGYTYFSKWMNKQTKYIVILLTLLTGISRLYLGVHFLTDVLAGLLIGTIIGWLISKYEPILTNASFHISKLREDSILVIFFTIIIIIDLIIPEEYYGAYAILGYFIGYLAFKQTTLNKNLALKQPKQIATNFIGGTIILGILGTSAYYLTTGLIRQILFFTSGIFITLIWPTIISLISKNEEKQKIETTLKKSKKQKETILKKSKKNP